MSQDLQPNLASFKKLDRFFSKLLGEVSFFQADCVEFVTGPLELKVSIKQAEVELKFSQIKKSWLELIKHYLEDHCLPASSSSKWNCQLSSNDQTFYVNYSIEGNGQEQTIKLNGFLPALSQSIKPCGKKRASIEKIEVADDFFLTAKNDEKTKQQKVGPLQILIVEDDADQRSIVEMVLKQQNYEVLLAGDGEEALTVLEQATPDLIITDLMMPNMDGFTFVKALKEDQRLKLIPVLVLTVLGDEEREYRLLALGVDDYCEKTVQRKILLQRIENLLKRVNS